MAYNEFTSTIKRERLRYNNFSATNYGNNTGRIGEFLRAAGVGYTEETIILSDLSSLLFSTITNAALDIVCSNPGGQSIGQTARLYDQNKNNISGWYGSDIDFDTPFAVAAWSSELANVGSVLGAGTYTFLNNATFRQYVQDCIDDNPGWNWGQIIGVNFGAVGWGLDLDSIKWKITHTPPTYPVWGAHWAGYSSATLSSTLLMGGTSPNPADKDLKLRSISVYVGATHTEQVRLAVYQGGALNNPVGASLVYDFGVTSGSGTTQWLTLTHPSGGVDLQKNAPTWLAFKCDGGGFTVNYELNGHTNFSGDCQTARGRWLSTGISNNENTAYPSTVPSGGSFTNTVYPIVMQYEEVDPVSDMIIKRRRHQLITSGISE